MMAIVASYYKWSPDTIESLTPRQIRGWTKRIVMAESIFNGVEPPATDEEIIAESKIFGLKGPVGM